MSAFCEIKEHQVPLLSSLIHVSGLRFTIGHPVAKQRQAILWTYLRSMNSDQPTPQPG